MRCPDLGAKHKSALHDMNLCQTSVRKAVCTYIIMVTVTAVVIMMTVMMTMLVMVTLLMVTVTRVMMMTQGGKHSD